MLSRTNEMIAVGALILYLAFVPSSNGWTGDLFCSPVGKLISLATIVYVHQKVSCPLSLLLVIAYLRCGSSWEGFETPTTTVEPTCTCPDGYAYDSIKKICKVTSSAAGSIPPVLGVGANTGYASTSTPPPNTRISTAPMTTPMPTMPPVTPPITTGGVQPAMSTSSSSAGL